MLFRSDRKSTRLNSSHLVISYAVFCLKKKKNSRNIGHLCLIAIGVAGAGPRARRAPFLTRRAVPRCPLSRAGPPSASFFFFLKDRPPPELNPFPPPALSLP